LDNILVSTTTQRDGSYKKTLLCILFSDGDTCSAKFKLDLRVFVFLPEPYVT